MINLKEFQNNLIKFGFSVQKAQKLVEIILHQKQVSNESAWQAILKEILDSKLESRLPFSVVQYLYEMIYPNWQELPAPIWFPNKILENDSNVGIWLKRNAFQSYHHLHQWSITKISDFWQQVIQQLNIKFDKPYSAIVDLSQGLELPKWFPNSQLNIINSCFPKENKKLAIISQTEKGEIHKISYEELDQLSNRIANSLSQRFKKGDAIAIIMPMTIEAIAIYLAIIKADMSVVSIADSFSSEEIVLRLNISQTQGLFTKDFIQREGKNIPLFEKINKNSNLKKIILAQDRTSIALGNLDEFWEDFLDDNENFQTIASMPEAIINILFSSGTTGEPKAIPWTQTVPIKCASDAYFHHNIKPGDIFCWPTNLGWMMGPWLIFACFLNQATIAIYEGSPNTENFGQFIQDQKVNILGVVPTLVKTWRLSRCMEKFNWQSIKLFSSTGESSNIEDMHYLMWLANYKPIIEYCGGTEIGGGYLTSVVTLPNAPSAFNCKALGLDFAILDHFGHLSEKGEVAIRPPSIGLSTTLLNKDHHHIYYQDMPSPNQMLLRRHGDEIEYYRNGYYRIHGRSDDTMNLGGIKVSALEIEQILNQLPSIYETAAIAISPKAGGPSRLIIYAVLKDNEQQLTRDDILKLQNEMQENIKQKLNPLFKISEVIPIKNLPRTASNKMMRRVLRDRYGLI